MPSWSTGSAKEGRAANSDRNLWVKMTGSFVMSNENVFSGLIAPWSWEERSRPPISVENRCMMF